MKNIVTQYLKGCVLCLVTKSTNKKLGLYTPLPIPIRPWESVSMDFVGDFPCLREAMNICISLWIYLEKCAC